ncbi:MAG: ABC-F family ATP-binding cassette domain-containing protein [Acidimicrobiia bacterium]|nr:ABC-F family ATP-binding cassette domain-containing protein [Acidimicrobiia bacterium]
MTSSSAAPLRAVGLTVVRGPATVLDSVDLAVASGHRVGLIGPNGVGKTTLLRAMAGLQPLERGTVHRTPLTATVGYLPQEPLRSPDETVTELLTRRTGVRDATVELDAATAALATGEPRADDRYAEALDLWLELGGADLDARLGKVLDDLGLARRLLDQPTTSLSGGEAARVGLAALLLSRFQVFLLDEPTNDLDLDGLDRLERWITGLSAGVVLVSHDRTFLARTVTHVVELDEFTHRVSTYAGGWQAYLDEREAARRHAWERFEQYDTQRRGLAHRAQREREWASQGVAKVRRSDESDKHVRHHKIVQTEQLAGRAARTERAMERLETADKPREPWQLRLTVGSPGRSGDVVARLTGVVVDRGPFRLGPIDLFVGAGERIALRGANGSGKSTLLDAMRGRADVAAGDVYLGPSVVIGEVEQARTRLHGAASLLRAFQDSTGLDAEDARTLLAKFGLVADHVVRPTETLSPGERTRASLALLMANGANVLVLDEPTNHLDLPAIEQLEAALDSFEGTLLLVTHDRTLLEHVRLTRTLEMDAGQIVVDRPSS